MTMARGGPPLAAHTRAVRPDEQHGAGHPALIARTPAGTCPLLSPDLLCSVHAEHGEDALPRVCHTYPRGLVRTGHEVSMFLSLGCPEAARLALADPEAMDMVPAQTQPSGRLPVLRQHRGLGLATSEELADPEVDGVEAAATVFMDAARRLLRDPRLTVWQAWALYWQKAIETLHAFKTEPRPAFTSKLGELSALSDLGENLVQMTQIAQSAFVAKLLPPASRLKNAMSYACDVVSQVNRRFDTPVRQTVRQALALPNALALLGIMEAAREVYEAANRKWFEPFDNAHPHLLKNHLLNRLALRNFPANGVDHFAQELAHEAMDLDVLRVFLVGQALVKQERFGIDDYVLLVQTFTRYIVPAMDATPVARGVAPQQ
jgi:lysine-N-methylase